VRIGNMNINTQIAVMNEPRRMVVMIIFRSN
jgi:hypothetical protein